MKQGYVLCLRDEIICPSRKDLVVVANTSEQPSIVGMHLAILLAQALDNVLEHSVRQEGDDLRIDVGDFAKNACLPLGQNPKRICEVVAKRYEKDWNVTIPEKHAMMIFS